jgi:hypothetical protein
MRRRLPRADKKLILPGNRQAPEQLVLPGDDTSPPSDDAERQEWTPTVVLQEGMREVTATTLAEEHQGVGQVHRELQSKGEDWGDGMTVFPEVAHVLRDPDGSIKSVVPLSEIPGVEYTREDQEAQAVVAESKPTPVPLGRKERHQLVSIMALRLFNYYGQLPRDYPGYNPFRDGVPERPEGRPDFLKPDPSGLYPATNAEIFEYLKQEVGKRATVINKKRFGGGIQDLAVQIK